MIPAMEREHVRARPAATVPPVRWRPGFLASVVVLAGAMALPVGAAAATPTISEAFSPGSIELNGTSTLTFTISNPDGSLHMVSFDDTLPAGLQVVGTPTTTCMVPPAVVSSGGSSDVAFTDAALTDTSCTVSAAVQGVQAGHWDNLVMVSVDGMSVPVDAAIDVVAPPSISAGFGTSLLGLDGTTPLTFTIANPNPNYALSGVAFTDTLPAGLVVAGPPGGTCSGAVTAVAGTDSVGLSGGQLSPASSCTVSARVVATATGALSDTTTQVTSNEGGIGNTATAGLNVIGPPTVTLSSPVGGQVYAYGQRVRAIYSCADDPSGPGIASCAGDIPSGLEIDTSKAGPHTFTVTATSNDGGSATDIVFYSVAPDNRFSVAKPRVGSGGTVAFALTVPGPGRIDVVETVSGTKLVFARGTATARRSGTVRLRLRPTAQGREAMKRRRNLRLVVIVGYTPTGGSRRTTRSVLKL